MSNKQPGSKKILGIITAAVLVGILGFISWKVYNQPSKRVGNAATNYTNQPTRAIETAATVTAQGTYLDMKELGVKVTLDSSFSDATYSVRPSLNDGSSAVDITAQSLTDKGCGTDTLGLVVESPYAPKNLQGTLPVDNKTVFQFGNKYYQYIAPQNLGCLSDSQADLSLYSSKLQAFKQAFTTLQSDN